MLTRNSAICILDVYNILNIQKYYTSRRRKKKTRVSDEKEKISTKLFANASEFAPL